MLRWFLPKESTFFDFFEAHAALIVKACETLHASMVQEDRFSEGVIKIQKIEREADTITHQCVEALHKTFITPIERNDIHRLIKRMDDIVDYVEDVSSRIAIYDLFPMHPEAIELSALLQRASQELENAIKGMRNLKYVDTMRAMFISIAHLENEADMILMASLAKLFRETQDPLTVIKWKEIYEDLESAVDRCQEVANIVEGVILEND